MPLCYTAKASLQRSSPASRSPVHGHILESLNGSATRPYEPDSDESRWKRSPTRFSPQHELSRGEHEAPVRVERGLAALVDEVRDVNDDAPYLPQDG